MKLPQIVPILTNFTARVAGHDVNELLQSPTTLARALAETQTVVGHDGILNIFDPSLLSSACVKKQDGMGSLAGTDARDLTPADDVVQTTPLATLLESIQPLRHHVADRAMIIATFTGPGLLYSQLQPVFETCNMTSGDDVDYVLDVILAAVRSALEFKADGIALIEQSVAGIPSDLLRCHKTVRNLVDFYDAGFLVFRLPGAEDREPAIPAHCVFDLASVENGFIPLFGQLEQDAASTPRPVSTAGDVPESTPVEELKALLQQARRG
jgi:hypothetical protein